MSPLAIRIILAAHDLPSRMFQQELHTREVQPKRHDLEHDIPDRILDFLGKDGMEIVGVRLT